MGVSHIKLLESENKNLKNIFICLKIITKKFNDYLKLSVLIKR